MPGQPAPDPYTTVSVRNPTCNYPIPHPVLMRTNGPPIQPSKTIHEPNNQHVRLVVGPEGRFAGPYGTCRSRRSSTQNNCIVHDCSTHSASRLGKTMMDKKGKRVETVQTAFQDLEGRKFRHHPEQPLRGARGRDCAAIGGPAKTINSQGSSSVYQGYPTAQRRCGGVYRVVIICLVGDRNPPISCSTPRDDTAFCPHTWSAPSCPRITCDDGDGDVKPAHPSGPGTYGHAM